MKRILILATTVIALASCSNDEVVTKSDKLNDAKAAIGFVTQQQNITRATESNLEALGHYNFGVWAFKYKDAANQNVMLNYLVGYADKTNHKGYDPTNATTWAETIGSQDDHTSPWFYEGLGSSEYNYTGSEGYYKNTDADYMSANKNQYLRYWDLAYTNTGFYAYAPYKKEGVSFSYNDKKMTFTDGTITAGYNVDPSKNEFMVAGAVAKNADKKDVKLNFTRMGAQVKIRFYEAVPGYKVKLLDVKGENSGVQATPATESTTEGSTTKTYTKGKYATKCGAEVTFDNTAKANVSATYSDGDMSDANLIFSVPTEGTTEYTASGNTKYQVIPEAVASGSDQSYATSSTIYYPVAQKSGQNVGFTFHVTFQLIAEDNGETITVHNATVFVPSSVTTWAAMHALIGVC